MRVLLACGMSLLAASAAATAVGDGQGASDVRIVPDFTFSPGNFNRPETSQTAPSPCFRLTFVLRSTAPVFHAEVTQDADLPFQLKSRRPHVGAPRQPGDPIFVDAPIQGGGVRFTSQYCRYLTAQDSYEIHLHVRGVDVRGDRVFLGRTYDVVPDSSTTARGAGGRWTVHCANC